MEQGHEMVNFGDPEAKGQGHTSPKLELEVWQRHVVLSRFSSSVMF